MMSNESLESLDKKQIITFLHNAEYKVKSLHKRLKALTGCAEFGTPDGMNGQCVECFYEDRELFDECFHFCRSMSGNMNEWPEKRD